MDDAVTIALELGANLARILGKLAPPGLERTDGERGQEPLARADRLLEAHGGQRRGTRCGTAAPTKSAANASPSVP